MLLPHLLTRGTLTHEKAKQVFVSHFRETLGSACIAVSANVWCCLSHTWVVAQRVSTMLRAIIDEQVWCRSAYSTFELLQLAGILNRPLAAARS
jgi:hypothetical protein